jgi:hypothetical protein
MEISKSKEPGHVDIAVPAIHMGKYNDRCGKGLSVDLRLHANLASLFKNLEHQFPWANHKPLHLNRFQAGFEEVLRDEPILEFESPDDELISQVWKYLQEHNSLSPLPVIESYNPGIGDITTVSTLTISVRKDENCWIEISESTTSPSRLTNDDFERYETRNCVTKKCVSRDKLLETCDKWIPGLRMALA